jgi:hypothetical protein
MDAKLEFEVDVEVSTNMVDREEERDSWLIRRGIDK